MITNFKLFEEYSNDEITNLVNVLMNGKSRIETDWGVKTGEGLFNMILNNDAGTVATALLNYRKKLKTLYGPQTLTGIKNMILNVYDYDLEQDLEKFNI